jgi:SAM-dependent methyltransferase
MVQDPQHFGFGRNWERYIKQHFSEERVEISRKHILDFLNLQNLEGKYFLDVGCGSGIHSLAALRAGAARVVSFDLDPAAVNTTNRVREFAGNPDNWQVMQGSILDARFLQTIEPADIVYSWGVLHHTGAMWPALENTIQLLKDGAVLYVALYTSGVVQPSDDFWRRIKQQYNQANWLGRRYLELWYIWEFSLNKRLSTVPGLVRTVRGYSNRFRGMEFYTNVVDWLGGWPMEFAKIEDVKKFAVEKQGLKLIKIQAGEANTEYLFGKN